MQHIEDMRRDVAIAFACGWDRVDFLLIDAGEYHLLEEYTEIFIREYRKIPEGQRRTRKSCRVVFANAELTAIRKRIRETPGIKKPMRKFDIQMRKLFFNR